MYIVYKRVIRIFNYFNYIIIYYYRDTRSYIYIYIYISFSNLSVSQRSMHGAHEPMGYIPGSSCFSLMFILNLINDKSKHEYKYYYVYCIVRGP